MAALGQIRPCCSGDVDSGLSPDSCRPGRMPMTEELGQQAVPRAVLSACSRQATLTRAALRGKLCCAASHSGNAHVALSGLRG